MIFDGRSTGVRCESDNSVIETRQSISINALSVVQRTPSGVVVLRRRRITGVETYEIQQLSRLKTTYVMSAPASRLFLGHGEARTIAVGYNFTPGELQLELPPVYSDQINDAAIF